MASETRILSPGVVYIVRERFPNSSGGATWYDVGFAYGHSAELHTQGLTYVLFPGFVPLNEANPDLSLEFIRESEGVDTEQWQQGLTSGLYYQPGAMLLECEAYYQPIVQPGAQLFPGCVVDFTSSGTGEVVGSAWAPLSSARTSDGEPAVLPPHYTEFWSLSAGYTASDSQWNLVTCEVEAEKYIGQLAADATSVTVSVNLASHPATVPPKETCG